MEKIPGFEEKSRTVAYSSSGPSMMGSFRRRDLVLFSVSSALLMFHNFATCATTAVDDDVKTAIFTDDINAYSFLYPLELPAKKLVFKWVESRKLERYSSAAPLSPDARQCIVSEHVDFINNVVISVSIGPPNSRFLTSTDKSTWEEKMMLIPFWLTSLHWFKSQTFLGTLWLQLLNGMMGPLLEKTVESFRLLPPTDNHVPPYKDPWRFW